HARNRTTIKLVTCSQRDAIKLSPTDPRTLERCAGGVERHLLEAKPILACFGRVGSEANHVDAHGTVRSRRLEGSTLAAPTRSPTLMSLTLVAKAALGVVLSDRSSRSDMASASW